MAAVQTQATGMGARFAAAANGLGSFSTRVGLMGGIISGFAVAAAAHFQAAAANVHAFAGASSSDIAAITSSAMRLAAQYGQSATAIVQSMYTVESAGIRGQRALQTESAGVEAAAASHAKLDEVMKALTTTLKDFPNMLPHDAVGQMTKVVQLGRMTWGEYANAISTVEPMASALHVPLSQLGALIAALTQRGNSAQETTMMLRNALTQLVTPTQQMRNAASALGLSWQDLYQRHGRNLIEVLHTLVAAADRHVLSEQQVSEATGLHGIRAAKLTELLSQNDAKLKTLTGTVLGYNTVLQTVLGPGYENTLSLQKQIEDGSNSLDQAWKGVSQTAEVSFDRMRESVRNAAIAVGTDLLPAATALMHLIAQIGPPIVALASQHRTLTAAVFGLATGFLVLGAALKAGTVVVDLYRQSFSLLLGLLRLLGVFKTAEEATVALSGAQRASATASAMQAAAASKSAAETRMKQAAEQGDLVTVERLREATMQLQAEQYKLAAADAQVAARQAELRDLRKTQVEAIVAEERAEVGLEQARVGVKEQMTALNASIARMNQLELQLNSQAQVTRGAYQEREEAMLAYNGAVQRAIDQGLTAQEVNDRVALSLQAATQAEERYTIAQQRQLALQGELNAATAEWTAEQEAALASIEARTKADDGLTAAQAKIIVSNQAVVATTGEVVGAEAAATEQTGLLAAATGALDAALLPVEGALVAIAGAVGLSVLAFVGIAAAIAAVIAVLVILYANSTQFRDLVNELVGALGNLAEAIGQKLMFAINLTRDALSGLWSMLTNTSGAQGHLTDAVLAFVPVIGPLVVALRHWQQLMKEIDDLIALVREHWSDLVSAFESSAPVIGGLVSAFQLLSPVLGQAGTFMDNYDQKQKKLGQSVGDTAEKLRQYRLAHLAAASATAQSANVVAKAAADWIKANTDIASQIKQLDDNATALYQSMQDHTGRQFDAMRDRAITDAKQMRAGVLAEIRGMLSDMPSKIQLPPLTIDRTLVQPNKATAGPTGDTRGSSQAMAAMQAAMDKLSAALGKLPPDFASAGAAIAQGFQDKITAAHNTFITALRAENQRHADALNAIRATQQREITQAWQAAQQARRSEDQNYLASLNTIQSEHERRVQDFLANMLASWGTMLSQFQAAMANIQARRDQAEQNHNQRLAQLNAAHEQQLAAVHGKYQQQQRDMLTAAYNRQVALEATRYAHELAGVNASAQQQASALQRSAVAQAQRDANWANAEEGRYRAQIQQLNEAHRRHVEQLQAALNSHVARIRQQAEAALTKENAGYTRHVQALEAALGKHVAAIEKSMKTAMDPGNLWDKIKQATDSLADKDMKALSLAILTHQGNLQKLTQAVVAAQTAQNKMNAAMAKAAQLVERAGGSAQKAAAALDSLSTKADKDYKNALASATLDIYRHGQMTEADRQALQRAIDEQNKVTKAQQAAAKIAESMGAGMQKAAKATQDAFEKAKQAADTKLQQAIDAYAEALVKGQGNWAKLHAAIDNAAAKAERYALIQERAAAVMQTAQYKAALAAGDFSTALEIAKKKVDDQLNKATAAYTMALLTGQGDLARLGQNMDRAALAAQRFQNASEQAAQRQLQAEIRAALATGNLATAFDKMKSLVDSKLQTAMSRAAMEFMMTGQISAATNAQLQQLAAQQARFQAAMEHVQEAVDQASGDFDKLKGVIDNEAKAALSQYAMAVYAASQGNQQAAASLERLRLAAVNAQQAADNMSNAESKATRQIQEEALARQGDYNSTLQHAKMVYEDAMAAYEDAIMHHASAEALAQLRQSADEAAAALHNLEQIATDAENQVKSDIGEPTDGLTEQQQIKDDQAQQKIDLQAQKQAFTENLDTAKLSLAQQRLADQQAKQAAASQKSASDRGNQLLQEQLAVAQAQLAATEQQLQLYQKALYMSRLGLSRIAVGNSMVAFLNSLGGSSGANVGA